jgi:hypothetical protein
MVSNSGYQPDSGLIKYQYYFLSQVNGSGNLKLQANENYGLALTV